MSIKRYIADADTTITNAFDASLMTSNRGTGSSMGQSDVLEVFSIYGQASSSLGYSAELSRVLIKFPIEAITSDRNAGDIPAKDNVKFHLRMFNARHAFTLPSNYTLTIVPVSKEWQEGHGFDMEQYKDITKDGEGANWVNAMSSSGGQLSKWSNFGGDFHPPDVAGNPAVSVGFQEGDEDLEADVTTIVEQWIAGTKSNYGIGLYLSGSQEAYFKTLTGINSASWMQNITGSRRSYYTKKFFARSSEYYFKRPMIEARWDSATKDDRGNFFRSSSLADANDNLNTLYLYNFVRGQLKNIPNVGTTGTGHTGKIYVRLYNSASAGDIFAPAGSGTFTALSYLSTAGTTVTGGYSSKGVYTASFALNTTASAFYDRWYTGASGSLHTGSAVTIKAMNAATYNPSPKYVTKITNLKSNYSKDEVPTFRLFIRDKNWNPSAYTVVNTEPENKIIEDAYYKLTRTIDNKTIINYGTGSDQHTKLSFDVSGNYFDLDMDMLEKDYAYGVKFVYRVNNSYREQPEIFKFRVE